MAFTKTDLRLILGFSSIAQLGFIMLGIFALDSTGANGALFQMINHGLVVVPAILIVALIAESAPAARISVRWAAWPRRRRPSR